MKYATTAVTLDGTGVGNYRLKVRRTAPTVPGEAYETFYVDNITVSEITDNLTAGLQPDVIEHHDYDPFGMQVAQRSTLMGEYRYGFQGQEKDNEIKGKDATSLNYTFRMHDPRVGRFFAVDPLAKDYAFYSPYQFSGNSTIIGIDMEGLELQISNSTFTMKENSGTTLLTAEADFKLTIKVLNMTGLKLMGTQLLTNYAAGRARDVFSDKFGTGNFSIPFDSNGKLLKTPINYKANAKIKDFSVNFLTINSMKEVKDGDLVMVLANQRLIGGEANAYVNCNGCNVMVVDVGAPEFKIKTNNGTVNFNTQNFSVFRMGKTIVHEIGHILGLVDQYENKQPKKGYENNIMADATQSNLTSQQVSEILNDQFFERRQNKHMASKGIKIKSNNTTGQLRDVLKDEGIIKK